MIFIFVISTIYNIALETDKKYKEYKSLINKRNIIKPLNKKRKPKKPINKKT